MERERQREHAARTVLEGAVSSGGVVLPEVWFNLIHRMVTRGQELAVRGRGAAPCLVNVAVSSDMDQTAF